jgi:hypothetical protein
VAITLSIEASEPVRVGSSFDVTVVVEASSEHHLRGLTITLSGQKWGIGEEGFTGFLSVTTELLGDTQLPAGTHRFKASFTLDEDLPPSCSAGGLYLRYQLVAFADVAWWFDEQAIREIAVERPPLPERPPPKRVTVNSGASAANELFLELLLDDTTFAPGESVTGAFSVGSIRDRRLDGATIAIVHPAGAEGTGMGEVSVFVPVRRRAS